MVCKPAGPVRASNHCMANGAADLGWLSCTTTFA
jgi:hypothetical protein